MYKIPDSYFKGSILACYILLIPLYAFFFLLGAKPFHLDTFMDVTEGQLAFRVAIMVAIEIVVVLISRLIMLLVRSKHQLNYTGFIIWEILEGVTITMFCALFVWLMEKRTILYVDLLPKLFLVTCSILVFPYIIVALLSELKDKDNKIAKNIVTIEKYASGQIGREDSTLPFLDEKKALKLAVTANAILYLEAADNYVNICYLNNDKLVRFPLRNSMRSIEQICESNNIVRCHRSYYVNLRKVRAIQKGPDGLFAELSYAAAPHIPISSTYSEAVTGKFSTLTSFSSVPV
ncbi:MAG: LytTR family transcriptional regulator [Bacteroidaceae bacterium]|nr:LytTR family transcriptional regulator [Bacteroidaceae bacterium]MBP5348175.1 LytTR family transcriptional regulator [Bacteroidaceae bacterium]MBR4593844.1 LytTR family transcriptional regulator [Bacteroidaceae bacterium]